MDLDKRRYTQKQVALIFEAYKKEYEKRFAELRARINALVEENNRLKLKLDKNSDKESLILAVLSRAEKTASDLEKQSKLEYELELERLKKFSEKWNAFFEKLNNSKTSTKEQKKAVIINEQVKSANKSSDAKKVIKELDKLIESDKKTHPVFDPKKKIGEYIATTSDSGFNMEEVLNPGELKLEDICKELGLLD